MQKFRDIGTGKPVVLIHGFLENGKMWDEFSKDLSNEYRLIIPDLYGHGETPSVSNTHTMETQAKGIVEILNHLKITSAAFIGHSMGGYTALAIARDYPEMVERLCLFFSSSQPDSEEKKEQRLKAVETAEENRESFVKLGVKNLFDQNNLDNLREEIEFARSLALEMPLDGITAALRGMREREDTTKILENADNPVEIVLGKYDGAVDADKYLAAVPKKSNIKTHVLSVGHMGHLEAPQESLNILKQFLKK